jgi:predicted dehydrogenase
MKKVIDDGLIGDIVSVNAEECVGNVHQSHSFVRGNWGNSEKSSPMLLQKCCHDLDILQWLNGKKLKKVQSFGTLKYFKEANAPAGSPDYCYQGCPVQDTCPYNAVKIYKDKYDSDDSWWYPKHAAGIPNPTDAHIENIIKNTQYGKCVFKCDNDVVDHQTLNALYEDDITLTFSMNAFNKGGRTTHIFGTKGELKASESKIEVYDFETAETKEIPIIIPNQDNFGHGGGDYGIVCALYDYIMGTYTGNAASDIGISVENHIAVFAAEKSRAEGTIVDIDEYIASL